MVTNDLYVKPISNSLEGIKLDLVVSGSIGAVESVRFIRSLRRLGADVYPCLTQGASLFTTSTALAWASANQVLENFEGHASHIALRDACIVAPASANIISKVANGITDTPATALIASYLGQKKLVIFVPSMHDSLIQSPLIYSNIQKLKEFCSFLEPRREEGKQKFPDPATLADLVSHQIQAQKAKHTILITMGSTRGYIDSVRYISNYSSGALGSSIAEEFYRHGYRTKVVCGPCPIQPKVYSEKVNVETHEEMSEAVEKANGSSLSGAVFAASVLDFVPSQKVDRKIRSSEDLTVTFKRTSKIISQVTQNIFFKVGFKLESSLNTSSRDIALRYLENYQLSHLIMNQTSQVSESHHTAFVYRPEGDEPLEVNSKELIAQYLLSEANRILSAKSQMI